MIRKILSVFILLFLFVPQTQAYFDPLSLPNNRYGIHIADTNDLADVPDLVNSSGGDWGYVTLVITDGDRNSTQWQKTFNQMRKLHLIPIVRLATHLEGDAWVKPEQETLDIWVSFLSSLNWPIENRYVILFNEPNHAKEWGNSIDPTGYADILTALAKKLKASSNDYFILPAGFDASAASDNETLDEASYLQRMVASNPQVLDLLDGWTSHSYPNPAFSGSPFAYGRGTLRTYQWELDYLRQLGLTKNLPVFITETGWVHQQGKIPDYKLLSSEAIADNVRQAATAAWNDANIAAVTPFVFNYQDVPFDHFSWKILGENAWFAQYYAYQATPKPKGEPHQRQQYSVLSTLLPKTLVSDSTYDLRTDIKNVGQGILNADDYGLYLESDRPGFSLISQRLPALEPEQTGSLSINFKTPAKTGTYALSLLLHHAGQSIPLESHTVDIIPQPSLTLSAHLGWKSHSNAPHTTVLVYTSDGQLIHKLPNLKLQEGSLRINNLAGVIPGQAYRIVLLTPYYLPRQAIVQLSGTNNFVTLKRLLPFDLNQDGALTLADLTALFKLNPGFVYNLFFGN